MAANPVRNLAAFALLAVLGGCAVSSPRLEATAPTFFTSDKIAMKVGVYVPPEARAVNTIDPLPTSCFGLDFAPAPLGETFATTVLNHLMPLFDSVTPVGSLAEASRYDAVFEARLSAVSNKLGCLASPDFYFQVNGSLQAVDQSGRMFWRASTTSKRHDMPMLMSPSGMDLILGREASKALGSLVEDWTKEMFRVQAFADKRVGASGASGGQAEIVFWDSIKNSSNPADYRAYLETYPRGQFAALARVRAGDAAPSPQAVPPARPPAQAAPAATPAPLPPQIGDERRVALVIGNGSYATLDTLRTAVNDARQVATTLRALGYGVDLLENADYQTTLRGIGEFAAKLGRGGVGFVYVAGHAAQHRGENYVLPVDARIQSADDIGLQGVNISFFLSQLERASPRAGVFVLDSYRANPAPNALRSGPQGLAAVGSTPGRSVVLLAANPGQAPAESPGERSHLADALAQNLNAAGTSGIEAIRRAAGAVQSRSGGSQRPWISDAGMPADFRFRP